MFGLPAGVTAALLDKNALVLAAAEELGVPSGRAAVFEDALAGVEAGRAGHFPLVVGVDRVGQAGELRKHGADIAVRDLIGLPGQDAQADEGAR